VTAAERRGGGTVASIAEQLVSRTPPRFELVPWRRDLGLIAGITGRGSEAGRGFDLGLWSEAPVGEVMSHWQLFRRSVPGFSAVILGNQVHGAKVMAVGPSHGWLQVEGIDGLVTTAPGVLLTVTVADCIPVYLAVAGKGVGLLHAGWRGTAGGILSRGLQHLLEATASNPGDVVMHCGVGICGTCYEVGSEVMTGCGLTADGPGPWHLDLRSTLAEQAGPLGIPQVTLSSHCSAHDRPTFYSHRASKGSDGRMVAYLGIPAARDASSVSAPR
jgi:purine-nucleoside/S-methyl-5'-thioadenosine phosphorylase / adenosine deaminase